MRWGLDIDAECPSFAEAMVQTHQSARGPTSGRGISVPAGELPGSLRSASRPGDHFRPCLTGGLEVRNNSRPSVRTVGGVSLTAPAQESTKAPRRWAAPTSGFSHASEPAGGKLPRAHPSGVRLRRFCPPCGLRERCHHGAQASMRLNVPRFLSHTLVPMERSTRLHR